MPTTSGSMLCPSCRKLISVDEPRCPYCGALRPGLWGWGPKLQRFFGGRLELTPMIAIVCVTLFLLALAIDIRGMRTGGFLPLPSPGSPALYLLGMTGVRGLIPDWWSLFTAIYLHGGVMHIFFNVMWIRQLGAFTEDELGPARFFVLFSLAGAGGFVLSNFAGNASVGASGSIFGLLGAMIAFRRRRGRGGDMVTRQFMLYAGVLFVFGLLVQFVDNWAHFGGFVTGYALGMRMNGREERPEGRNVQVLALGLLAVTILGFVLSIVTRLPEFTNALQTRGL